MSVFLFKFYRSGKMDHLPNVERKHVEVPFFIQARVFYPEEFFSLLDGKEAGPNLLKKGPPASMSREHCNDFFQRLLFFSLLAQFLGVKVDSAKFKQNDAPQPRLTTRILNKLLRTWEATMDPENPDYVQEIQRQIRVGLALSEARAFVSKWCSDKRMKKPKANNFDNSGSTLEAPEIDPRLCLSFMILGETLDKALNRARQRRDKLEKEGKLQSIGALLYHLDRDIGIPSGMIFLPGAKLEVDGYRWAPKTWMYEQSQDFLYPLFAKDARTAFLTRRGLHVQYSGIEIHPPKQPLESPRFWIPRNPNKWYRVDYINEGCPWDLKWQTHLMVARKRGPQSS